MFDWSVIARSREELLNGFQLTVMLACLAGGLSLVGGLLLCAARLKARGPAAWVLTAYVELMRNTPLLITMYLIYFGLPMVGLQIPTFTCVVVVLVMQHSVFVSEVLRGGFLSVPLSQIEAGRAIGMRPFAIFRIVQLPQAWSASVPALMSVLVLLIHDTSLGAAISLVDLTMAAKVISQRTAASFEPFVAIAICYSLLSWLLSRAGSFFERRSGIAR
ncbi:polar amino acid transport system permease protein [Variovorax boronicumulans]|uniref:amino acid ABC transporter permease n=1 Tax=Variovorax TaxID=34072 RepID=UPI002783BF5D|nr:MULTISPECIES: amino acid ABC transporter permease [Variovorax]MDQ0074540.1 polar amino acid transport system permease protein [Variovorax boronicumulans]MDQ0612287.1 His/Glu/Gln/Arg/opine family amino acid ABC transporter permease subunit [Variovorax sp. W1I1]